MNTLQLEVARGPLRLMNRHFAKGSKAPPYRVLVGWRRSQEPRGWVPGARHI